MLLADCSLRSAKQAGKDLEAGEGHFKGIQAICVRLACVPSPIPHNAEGEDEDKMELLDHLYLFEASLTWTPTATSEALQLAAASCLWSALCAA